MNDRYSKDEKWQLLEVARNTIINFLKHGTKEYPPLENQKFQEKRGVFVTLHKDGSLRGCIGYPLPVKVLIQAVVDNAISAATEDPRFPAITEGELNNIDIEISILTVPTPVDNIDKVVIGRDGIIISKGYMKGLLLPQVPVEQGWDLEKFISYGCLKAGLSADEWQSGVKIETFQAIVFGERELRK